MNDPNCIFCKIAQHEIDTKKVYEDDDVIAFDDTEPLMPVHTLIIPKENHKDLEEIPDYVLSCFRVAEVGEIGQVLKEALVK